MISATFKINKNDVDEVWISESNIKNAKLILQKNMMTKSFWFKLPVIGFQEQFSNKIFLKIPMKNHNDER